MKIFNKDSIVLILSFFFIACVLAISSCSDNDENDVVEPESTIHNEKKILSFTLSIDSEYLLPVEAAIDESSKKISAAVGIDSYWRDYNLKGRATVSLSPNATIFPDPSVIRDYSDPVAYTVTAEDGSKQEYIVEVSKLRMKITSINKTTFEPGEDMILYGENLIANTYANNIFLIENGVEFPVYYNENNVYSTNKFIIRIHDHLEIGEYTLKIRAYRADSIEYDIPITVDYNDKSRKITTILLSKLMDNSVDPPLYRFSFMTPVRFLGATSYEQIETAKVYLVDASDENIKHLCSRKDYSWSEKFTNISFGSNVPNTVTPGKYYVEVEYDGITRSPEPIDFPW